MLEKHIEKWFTERVKYRSGRKNGHSKSGICYKFTSPARRNVPDRMVVLEGGELFFVEFKAPGKKPNVGQQREIERLRNLGQTVYVIDSIEDAQRVLEMHGVIAKKPS